MSKICYIPEKCDRAISEGFPQDVVNAHVIATLRGLYDEKHPDKHLDVSNIEEARNKLIEFRRELIQNNAKAIKSVVKNPTEAYKTLKGKNSKDETSKSRFSAIQRKDRVSLISRMFSDVVDAIQEANPGVSRKAICNGFKVNGKLVCGQFSIFNRVYQQLMEERAVAVEEGNTELVNSFDVLLDTNVFAALCSYARVQLRRRENLILGNDIEYAIDDDINEFGDNDIEALFEASESGRDHYHEMNDLRSSFNSLGAQVRKILDDIPIIDEEGNYEIDDMGYERYHNPTKLHRKLMEILRGMTSPKDMMNRLRKVQNKSNLSLVSPIIEVLENNPELQTAFFNDFRRTFQPYTALSMKLKDSIYTFKTLLLNRRENGLLPKFLLNLHKNYIVDESSIFGASGRVNKENVKSLINKLTKYFYSEEKSLKSLGFNSKGLNNTDKAHILHEMFKSLNIDIEASTVANLFLPYNRKLLNKVINRLKRLTDNKKVLENTTTESANYSNIGLYRQTTGNQSKTGFIEDTVKELTSILYDVKEGARLESRCKHIDKKGNTTILDSYVNPSYLGDFIDLIRGYIDNSDREGLKLFLESKYGTSSFFKHNDQWLNRWIEDLLNDKSDFAEEIMFTKFAGSTTENFENFTEKKDAISKLQMYFAPRQISAGSDYAYYPVFILGDSGVSKYIKAKRYSKDNIVNGLYNCYRQEIRRMNQASAFEKLNGKTIQNYSERKNEFTILTFLNDPKYKQYLNNPTEENIKKAISEYLTDYIKTEKKYLEDLGILETVTKNNKTSYKYLSQEVNSEEKLDSVLEDYLINQKFATIQQIQLMTIDSAFYENTNDLQKRYKEIHAPGTILNPYAINEYSEDKESYCGVDENGNPLPEVAVYFKDIRIKSGDVHPKFLKAIEKAHGENSKVYEQYVKKPSSLTDGQGYRTLDSYRKVMGMAGKWTAEMEIAYNTIKDIKARYKRNESIKPADIQVLSDLAVVFQPIKPFMFTQERVTLNDSGETMLIPVQHKYAEIVLIPELLTPNSKLREIAYWMEDEKVDVLCATTAVKVGGWGETDIQNITDTNELRTSLSNATKHYLNYSDYRIQTNVPEHINSSSLYGTQVRKLAIANINKSKDYSDYFPSGVSELILDGKGGAVKHSKNGRGVISLYNNLIVSNILDSYKIIKDVLKNTDETSARLIQSVISNDRESLDNIIAYSLTKDKRFLIPLFEGALEHDSIALLLSIFKKAVNKQTIAGGSAVQASALGIGSKEDSGDLQYVVDPDKPSNILYAECEIPFALNYTDANGNIIELDYNKYCNEDGSLKLVGSPLQKNDPDYKRFLSYTKDKQVYKPLIEEDFPGILTMIAYRIPTERSYSMMNLKVKRFSKKIEGGVIKVPLEGTTIAGFDYDIDKLYFMRKQFVVDKTTSKEAAIVDTMLEEFKDEDVDFFKDKHSFIEYDYTKAPSKNHKVARNNLLIDLISSRLSDPETMKDRTTPGGFDGLRKTSLLMRELKYGNNQSLIGKTGGLKSLLNKIEDDNYKDPEPEYDYSSPSTLLHYNQQNQVAGKLIGIFANQNINHAFASLMIKFKLKDGYKIAFGEHAYDGGLGDLINGPQGVNVDINVAEYLAAAVDAVKDPVLSYLNLNTVTANVAALLARIGYSSNDIGLLLNQPIIREVCDLCFNEGINITSAINDKLRTYQKDYKISSDDIIKHSNNKGWNDSDRLIGSILQDRSNIKDRNTVLQQLAVLQMFEQLNTISSELVEFISATKFTAANSVGSTAGDLYAQQMKVNKYCNKLEQGQGFFEIELDEDGTKYPVNPNIPLNIKDNEYYGEIYGNPFAFEQAMYDMNKRIISDLSKYYPYESSGYKNMRDKLTSLSYSATLDPKTINHAHKDFLVYILANVSGSCFNGNALVKGANIREYYLNKFPSVVFDIVQSDSESKEPKGLAKMSIFEHLIPTIEDNNITGLMIGNQGALLPEEREAIKESWEQLNEIDPILSRDLFMCNFFRLGFSFSPLTFMNLAPTSLKESLIINESAPKEDRITYTEFLNKLIENKNGLAEISTPDFINSFAIQFVLNHTDNNLFVYSVYGDLNEKLTKLKTKNKITIDLNSDLSNPFSKLVQKQGDKVIYFKPFIKLGNDIYMCSNGANFNMSFDGEMTYKKVTPQGYTDKSLYYSSTYEESNNNIKDLFDSELPGSTMNNDDSDLGTYNRSAFIEHIASEYYKVFKNVEGNTEEFALQGKIEVMGKLINQDDDTIKQLMEAVKNSVRENGVMVLDSNANPVPSC